MYAIIKTGGKQVKVSVGEYIYVEKIEGNVSDEYVFNDVLLISDESGKKKTQVGAPFIKGASVSATIEKQGRSKKIIVFKYRPKKNERKKKGHRQAYTKLKITKINS